METRIEVFIDGKWQILELWDRTSIKYKKIVNKIDSITTREISHSNTLSIPNNYNNITLLGINVFNKEQLAKALNSRYPGKYYINDKLAQEGFIVINSAKDDDIKINFIDSSLELIDKWGSTKFRDLLNSAGLSIPSDYSDAIAAMKGYDLSTDTIAPILGNVGTRGYNLCLFPNNLNAIGDRYMVDKDGLRPDNSICPYQSRPLFNSKSVFDLAAEAYGYTPIFDESVDWESVSKTYIVPDGLSDNFTDEGITTVFSTISYLSDALVINNTADTVVVMSTSARSELPANITGWTNPDTGWLNNYYNINSIFKPDLEIQSSGVVRYTVKHSSNDTTIPGSSYGVWINSTNNGVVFKQLITENPVTVDTVTLQYDINKAQLFNNPSGGVEFLGIVSTVETVGTINNFQITETFLPIDSVSYDERGQFEGKSIDLTYAAPDDTVKDLLSGLMSQFGILMDINNTTNEIVFYNYGRYLSKRNNGEFTDLSEYLLEQEPFGYNTDFGNTFGKLNELGLKEPFKGNTFFIPLENQGNDSKLKDFSQNLSKMFKDVEAVSRIKNTSGSFIEFTNTGLGLVTYDGDLDSLTQVRFVEEPEDMDPTFTTQGIITGVPALKEYSLSFLPLGISEWYRMVDISVKAKPKLLLPIDLVKTIDLTLPVYIEQMGGFYVVEEISEYIGPQEKVTLEVIKLITGAEFSDDFSDDFNI